MVGAESFERKAMALIRVVGSIEVESAAVKVGAGKQSDTSLRASESFSPRAGCFDPGRWMRCLCYALLCFAKAVCYATSEFVLNEGDIETNRLLRSRRRCGALQ